MTVSVITVGNLKESYLKEAVSEYKKRILQYARLEEIELREERIVNEDDRAEIARALDAEATRILSSIPKDAYKIALCVEGKLLSSPDLASLIGRAGDERGKLCFVIGSSHGLAPEVKAACDLKLSVSKLTFPHQMMRVLLLEVLYRSFSILRGSKYHK